MPFATAAGIAGIGAAGSVGSSLLGGLFQSGDVKSGQSAALAAQQQAIQTAQNQLGPWQGTGVTANTQESNLLGLNGQPAADTAMSTFQSSPGYKFDLTQGLRGVDAGAAAAGMLRSGATLKAEETFGTGLADQDFGNYWNRLQQLSGNGLTAAQGITSAATGAANQTSGIDDGAAIANANITGNVASSIGGQANQLLSNQNVQNWLTGGGGVTPTTAYQNGLYQAGQFAQYPAGTNGPFAPVS